MRLSFAASLCFAAALALAGCVETADSPSVSGPAPDYDGAVERPSAETVNESSPRVCDLAFTAGGCSAHAPPVNLCADVICPPSDSCHERGACDPETGLCSRPVRPNGSLCDDGNACTTFDTCEEGVCRGAGEVTCEADHCHPRRGECSPKTGLCVYPPPAEPPSRCTFDVPAPPYRVKGTCNEEKCVEGASRFIQGTCSVRSLCVPE